MISQTAALKCWDDDTMAEPEKHMQKYRTSRRLILDQLLKSQKLDPKNVAPADGGFGTFMLTSARRTLLQALVL